MFFSRQSKARLVFLTSKQSKAKTSWYSKMADKIVDQERENQCKAEIFKIKEKRSAQCPVGLKGRRPHAPRGPHGTASLKTTIKDGRVGVRWDVDDWIQYIGDQRDVLEEMHFPSFRDDHPYVLIVRGDGFPCGARSWCQIACGFANHMQKAQTLLYNWTLDLALVSEHETDLVCVLFGETLKKVQQIIDRGYMLLRGFWVRMVVIIGGDSPWLRHILGLSTFYEIGSIYSSATWSRQKERWVGCEW